MTSDPAQLFAEVAHLASVFHWSMDALLDLEHPDRRRFLELSGLTAADADGV